VNQEGLFGPRDADERKQRVRSDDNGVSLRSICLPLQSRNGAKGKEDTARKNPREPRDGIDEPGLDGRANGRDEDENKP